VPAYQLHGGVPRVMRSHQIAQFGREKGAAAFIMQPAAGSLGIDLSASATMVWFSLTHSFVDWSQANDRVALSPRAVQHIYLIAPGVDVMMREALLGDLDLADMMTTSPHRLLGE
jgi:hypothetical protein